MLKVFSNEGHLQKQLIALQSQLKQLKTRFGLNQIDKETYEITLDHLNGQILAIGKEICNGNVKHLTWKN